MVSASIDATSTGPEVGTVWRQCVGAGRVAEALRADFQKHLEMVQREVPFGYLRAHGVFGDDMMVYHEVGGRPVLNWQYVDMVYDHWLSVGIRPFVELSFMPADLASGHETIFWWRGNITPPRDWDRWTMLVSEFVKHLIARYGRAEVRQWYFEVWNEPNLDVFWAGADFDAYLQLYQKTVKAIKSVDAELRVGGPASSGAGDHPGCPPWAERFLASCRDLQLPVDFFSTHPYPTFHQVDISGQGRMAWDGPDRLVMDLRGARDLLASAGYGDLARHFTEWSSSPSSRDLSHDTAFMAPFVVRNNLLAQGLADSLSFWAVSDIFEENRLGDVPFHGGFGLLNAQGLKKPAYHGYWFLSRVEGAELATTDSLVAARRSDGTVAVLMWNYCHYRPEADSDYGNGRAEHRHFPFDPYELFQAGRPQVFDLTVSGLSEHVRVSTTKFDREHGSVYDFWRSMGSPSHLLREDIATLTAAAEPPTESRAVSAPGGNLQMTVSVEPHGVTLLELVAEPPLGSVGA